MPIIERAPRACSGLAPSRSSLAVAAALTALVGWSSWARWQLLAISPFPLGVDGYFYPVELRALIEHGALAYPASPLALYLLAPFAALTDPIAGAKLGAALLGGAIALPAYGLGARIGGGRGPGLVAAVLATTSAGSTYLTAEFVKNSVGLTVALTALWLALRALDCPARGRIAAALVAAVAAAATHKMAAALVLLGALPAVWAATRRGAPPRPATPGPGSGAAVRAAGSAPAHGDSTSHPRRPGGEARGARHATASTASPPRWRPTRAVIAAMLAAVAVALAFGAWQRQRFLSPGDARLLGGLWSTTPHWSAPALVLPDRTLTLGYDALAGLALAILAGAAWAVRARRTASQAASITQRAPRAVADAHATDDPHGTDDPHAPAVAMGAAIAILAAVIGAPWLDVTAREGLGLRLRAAAFVPAALTAALALRAVLGRPRLRARIATVLAAALLIARAPSLARPSRPPDGVVVTHPALVSAAQALRDRVPAGATLIVPERHIAFLLAWYTGADVALRPERVPPHRRLRVVPLHFIVEGSALDRALLAARAQPALAPPVGLHPTHPHGLVAVPEPTWDWALTQVPAGERARLVLWPTL